MMLVSFVIPHKGREELLLLTVDSIFLLDFPISDFEIIIVTQNSTLTFDKLTSTQKSQLTIIHRPITDTISTLRNVGAETSQASYLAFLDADISLSANWLTIMIEEINERKIALVSAVQNCARYAPSTEKTRTALCKLAQNKYVGYVDGHNLFLTKSIFNKTGGFPEHLLTCEDIYFTGQVSKLGKIFITSKAFHIHLGEDKTYKQLFLKEIWRGQSNLQSLKGRQIPLRELPSLLIPIYLNLFFLLMLVSIFRQNIYWFIISLILLFLPCVLYAIRLKQQSIEKISFMDALKFYGTYMPARAIGTIKGIYKTIHHKFSNQTF